MAKRAPLYAWQIEKQEDDNQLKRIFINENGEKLNLNKRFISPNELADIKENYNLKNELLDEIITDSNGNFINNNEEKFKNEFESYLDSLDKIIDDNKRDKICLEYYVGDFDFYKYLKFDELIDKHNRSIENHHRLVLSNALNDENRYIDNVERKRLKSYFPNNESVDNRIYRHNRNLIKKREKEISIDFENHLKSRSTIFSEEDVENLKDEYNERYCEFFECLDLKTRIVEFNEKIYKKQYPNAFDILEKEYGSLNLPVSKNNLLELESKYPDIEWEGIVKNYNQQYFSKKYESNKTYEKVYFLQDYIREGDRKYYNSDEVKISEQIIKYKNGVPGVVSRFTRDLILFIEDFANYEISSNVEKIFLVSIPSSSKSRDKNSSIKKSIKIIVNRYQNGLIELNNNLEIINLNDLLYRKVDIKPGHLPGERPTYEVHMETIGLNKNKLKNFDNGVFIILDDITTSGNIMMACGDILVENGIKPDRICKLAIGATR